MKKIIITLTSISLFIACTACFPIQNEIEPEDGPPVHHIDVSKIPNATPKVEPKSVRGNRSIYEVNGQRYSVMKSSHGYKARGLASWYGTKFHNRYTSNGEVYDLHGMTAAHRSLPLPCYVRVTNLENNRHIIVRVNDRGPFHEERIIDLSYVAAKKLGIVENGTALVEVEVINPLQYAAKKKPHKFFLQIGKFSHRAKALQRAKRIAALIKQPVYLAKDWIKNTPIYHVQIGPLMSTTLSKALYKKIKNAGLGNAIRITPPIS